MSEMVAVGQRKFRTSIPEAHQASLDTRIQWLWNQRFGTVQMIWKASQETGEVLDHTACTLILQAIMGKDLESITLIFQRLEGSALLDEEQLERSGEPSTMRF